LPITDQKEKLALAATPLVAVSKHLLNNYYKEPFKNRLLTFEDIFIR
jgi:hypothetical protein